MVEILIKNIRVIRSISIFSLGDILFTEGNRLGNFGEGNCFEFVPPVQESDYAILLALVAILFGGAEPFRQLCRGP